MQFELIGMDDEGWRHALECVAATIYHQPSYLRTAEQFEEGQLRIAFLREGNQFLGVPLLLRQVPQEISDSACWLDAKSPYGYVSPISSTNDRDQLKCFWEALANNLQAQGIISIFCRSHPLLRSVYQTNALPECGRVVSHGRTIWIDLELPDEEIWRQTNHGHRRNINSLRRQGFECQFDQWQHYDDFIKIYWDTMSRVDASAFYFFSKEYFYALRNNLEDDVHLKGREILLYGSKVTYDVILELKKDGILRFFENFSVQGFSNDTKIRLESGKEIRLFDIKTKKIKDLGDEFVPNKSN